LIDFDPLKESAHQKGIDDNKKIDWGSRIISAATQLQNYQTMRRVFREYYFKFSKNIESPREIRRREFAFRYWGVNGEPGGMVRHLAFENEGEILATALKEVPCDLYCSNGYYRFPAYPMQQKEWLGADLIFDIDTKDLHLSCQLDHSYLICERCGNAAKHIHGLDKCPSCNSPNLGVESLPCRICLDGAKKEVQKLFVVLTEDFGIEDKDIQVYFSGNDGFHLHVADANFQFLDAQARADMTGYILGKGILPETIGVYRKFGFGSDKKKTNDSLGLGLATVNDPSSDISHTRIPDRKNNDEKKNQNNFRIRFPRSGLKYGWRKRLAQDLGIMDLSESKLKNIVQKRGGYHGFRMGLDKTGKGLGVNIDPQVTMDVHRVFRMPGTINSKSGLTKMKCVDLTSFNPLNEACLLSDGELKVRMKAPVRIKLKGQAFKINETLTSLPAYAAIYLVCKRLAIII
jgi:DNA primase small subunit